MVQVIGCKKVITRNSKYLLILIFVDGKLKCICRKTGDRSFGKHSRFPVGFEFEVANVFLQEGKRMQLGNIFTSEVLHIKDVK